ncbi:MAG: DUF3806 domain-containing protein [Asticcacaulis sp.]
MADLNRQRGRATGYTGFFGNLNTIEGQLQLIDAILADEKAMAGGVLVQQAIGVVLGDAVAQAKGLSWYMLDANIGRGPCLGLPGTTLKLLPVMAFADAIVRGDKPSARDLFDLFCRRFEDLKAQLPR